MRYVLHTFRSLDTIDAVIRLKFRHDLTHDELRVLRIAFNQLNDSAVPRPGMMFKIPAPFETVDDYGDLVNTTPPELIS